MPALYSYKVRVLAALDAHDHPPKPTPIPIHLVDSKYEYDCNANRLFLPPTWKKRVKSTLDNLVAENLLTEKNGNYILTPRLRTIIAEEKVRLNVNQRNHEWMVFAGVAKKTKMAPVSNSRNAAPSSTPAGRANRTSLSTAHVTPSAPVDTFIPQSCSSASLDSVRVSVAASLSTPATRSRNQTSLLAEVRPASPTPTEDVITVRKGAAECRKVRYSDPGPLLSQEGLSSSTPTTWKRRPLGSSSQAPTGSARSTSVVSSCRRRSIAPSRTNRRYTLAVAPTRPQLTFPEPVEPVSREIQFFPLKQTLSARTRRALRRNALSEEMNDIDAEKRTGQKKNRELLAKLRAELAESTERLRELERELAAAKFAPSVEPEELGPINEEREAQEDDDYDIGYVLADSPEPYVSVTSSSRSPSSAGRLARSIEAEQPPPSNRDQRIRDLEAMIESLRQDITQRAEEERLRAQEDEVFHDAEEQILHEENNALAERIEELTALNGKTVSFGDDVDEVSQEGEGYIEPLAEGFHDEATDTEGHPRHLNPRSSGVDSGIGAPSQMALGMDPQNEKIAQLEAQNGWLHGVISTLNEKIRKMEGGLKETQMSLVERKKAQDKLKKGNEKLRRLQKELEEMEGERLENVRHMVVQTDEMVDGERVEMEEKMNSLAEQVAGLQEVIKVVTEEKRDAQAKIAVTDAQIMALQSAAEIGEAAKLEAETRIDTLTKQIADLEGAVSEKKKEIEHTAKVAYAQIANLQEVAVSVEAAKNNAEAQILTLTSQVKALEEMAAKERAEAGTRLADLKAAVESGEVAKDEAQAQITCLMNQIRDIEAASSKECGETKAKIADMQAIIGPTKAAQEKAQAQIHNLEEGLRMKQVEAKSRIDAANMHIAELESAAESNEAAMEDAESQIRILRRGISDLEADASTFEEDKNEMQQEIDILNRQVERMEEELEEVRKENAGLVQEVKDWEAKGKGFEEAVGSLRQDKASLEKGVEKLQKEVGKLESVAADLANAKTDLGVDCTNLNSQLVSQQKALKFAEKTSAQFQQEIVELRSHIEDFEKAAEISRNEKESFERDISSLQDQISSLESARKLSGDENQDLQNNIDELCTQIEFFKQAIGDAGQEKNRLDNAVVDLCAQVEALKGAGKVVEQQKESLQQTLDNLNKQLAQLTEELDVSRAEIDLSKQNIEGYKSKIDRISKLLDSANRDKDGLRHDIYELEKKVVALEGAFKVSNEKNRDLEHNTKGLRAEITILKQTSEIADEQKSIIQQKIRPYIQSDVSLDMAVEEVLTELVMAKNRADENERLRTELSNKITILAQDDEETNSESINSVDIVEKLTDRFKEVRDSVEKLYLIREQSQGSPFEGYNLKDFALTGSNENALTTLGSMVGDLYQKVTYTQAKTQKMKEDYEKEKEQSRLYGSYLEDIAMAVGNEGQLLPGKAQTLDLVILRLSNLKQQIEATEEMVDELSEAVTRKDNTIRGMEMVIDSAGQREAQLNQKVVNTIAAHNITNALLRKAQIEIEELEATIGEKVGKERELLKKIEQQTISHTTTVKELEYKRDEAIYIVQKLLDDTREAKERVEHRYTQACQESELAVRTLQDALATSQTELGETNKDLEAREISHQQTIEMLEGGLAQSRGKMVEISRKLREQCEKLKLSSEEVKRQASALKRAEAQCDKVTNQLNSEIESNQNAITALERRIQQTRADAEAQQKGDQQTIASLKDELQTTRDTTEEERKMLQVNIRSQAEEVNQLTSRIEELEGRLKEVESSRKELDERLKVTESQSQLFREEANKAHGALMAQKMVIQQELIELKHNSDIAQAKMQGDITALKILLDEKSQRIQELNNVAYIFRSEKSKLQEKLSELNEENMRLEGELEIEQRKNVEGVQNLTNEANKFMARFGDVKHQLMKESKLRQAEGLKKRRKRAREEKEDEEGAPSRMPPTPASSVVGPSAIQALKNREGKRRRYDSGIGVDEEDEEFEGVSAVGV